MEGRNWLILIDLALLTGLHELNSVVSGNSLDKKGGYDAAKSALRGNR